eukprot:6941749-Prymnesium_polylepis.1
MVVVEREEETRGEVLKEVMMEDLGAEVEVMVMEVVDFSVEIWEEVEKEEEYLEEVEELEEHPWDCLVEMMEEGVTEVETEE